MKTRNEESETRGQSAEGEPARMRKARPWIVGGAALGVMLGVAAACGMFAGCGSKDSHSEVSANGSTAPSSAVEPAAASAAVATAAFQGKATGPAAQGAPAETTVREGLPPDLTVSVEDTLVTPGQAVEFVVQGTPDVAQMALSDGRDEPLPLVRDGSGDTWRVIYRVPLHPRHERFGVSVTAKTAANRWRRAWVFLHVDMGDATGACEEPEDNPDETPDQR